MPFKAEKLSEAVHRQLAEILVREIELPENTLVTILSVTTSHDWQRVEVVVSCLPESKQSETVKVLNKKKSHLRNILARKIRFKKVPELYFISLSDQVQ